MPVEAELRATIEADIQAVSDIRSVSMKMHDFIHRLNGYAAQIVIDKEQLTKTGYNQNKEVYFITLIDMITETHADRNAAEGKGTREQFRATMDQMRLYRTVLILVTEHIIDKTGNEEIKTALKKIRSDHTNLDILHDILALASILNDHWELADDFTPGGVEVNDEYLHIVTIKVEALLKHEGKPNQKSSERAMLVLKQDKLITLCLNAIDEIKKYAKGTFFMDMPYFRKHYTLYEKEEHNSDVADQMDEELSTMQDINTTEE